mgnify:CR=1 FL=1
MPKLSVYNISGQVTGEIELNDVVFGAEFNEAVGFLRYYVLRCLRC